MAENSENIYDSLKKLIWSAFVGDFLFSLLYASFPSLIILFFLIKRYGLFMKYLSPFNRQPANRYWEQRIFALTLFHRPGQWTNIAACTFPHTNANYSSAFNQSRKCSPSFRNVGIHLT